MRKKLIALVGAGLLLAGCSASEPVPTPTVTVVQTVTPEAPSEPVADADGPLAMGEPARFAGFSMTVHAVDLDPSPEPAPQPQRAEDKWASADIEYCTDSDTTITATWWRLVSTDSRQYQSSSTGYETFPEPAYAWGEVPVSAGTCHRGWLTFVVGKNAELESVRYANDKGDSADWLVG